MKYLNVPEVWKKSKGAGITVAVIDSGIDYSLLGKDFDKSRIKHIYNAIDESEDLSDYTLHGTSMVCLIGANGENSFYGIAPQCDFIIIKALNEIGSTNSEVLSRAINFATESGANIINLSLGSRNYNDEVVDAITNAYKNNIVITSAAGDDGKETVRFPASLNETISVGAIDIDGKRYKESNYGASVDVFVPAVDVSVPAYNFSKKPISILKSGSSVATAVMTGIIALYLANYGTYDIYGIYNFFRTSYENNLTKIIF